MIRPQMHARGGIDELCGDAHGLAITADTAFENISHAKLAADLLHINGVSLVCEA